MIQAKDQEIKEAEERLGETMVTGLVSNGYIKIEMVDSKLCNSLMTAVKYSQLYLSIKKRSRCFKLNSNNYLT